jgi:hypothetical protein
MAAPISRPSETSPLLSKTGHTRHDASHPIDASGGLVPEGADPYEDHDEPDDEEMDGGDIERQNSGPKAHEGMPEVGKQMKYLMPALGIGVCFTLLS